MAPYPTQRCHPDASQVEYDSTARDTPAPAGRIGRWIGGNHRNEYGTMEDPVPLYQDRGALWRFLLLFLLFPSLYLCLYLCLSKPHHGAVIGVKLPRSDPLNNLFVFGDMQFVRKCLQPMASSDDLPMLTLIFACRLEDLRGKKRHDKTAIFLFTLVYLSSAQSSCDSSCSVCSCNSTDVNTPLVSCDALPFEFLNCSYDYDSTTSYGCPKYGYKVGEAPVIAMIPCTPLPGITCCGPPITLKPFTCMKYSGLRFPTALLLSLFLGICGADRFYLGFTCMGVGKLLSVGGCLVWWLVDLILLIVGNMQPNDGSSWEYIF
ncbi:TM2 domain-containing protein [Planoprotostelium fungivorum]|uniref:TM2 domain-containing protein n=1 Tax=Planoprotostelium fungivorum TaxID=1890364 RepID=A0A2P6N174_9EUKA|nr:TM2 domain-containing protein [Planoprotostelium fungivorum]